MTAERMMPAFFAPSVHAGGGLVLLSDICRHWPPDRPGLAFLDVRSAPALDIPAAWDVHWIPRTFGGRLRAERRLLKESRTCSIVVCFHNLPPIFRLKAPVACYVQNPVLIGLSQLSSYTGWVRLRIAIERFISRTFKANVDHYLVQTPTMAGALARWLGPGPGDRPFKIELMPFADPVALASPETSEAIEFDFIYVSDGQAHKNHRRLFDAWERLSRGGLRPSLAVTLHPERDRELAALLASMINRHGLNITDLGQVPRDDVLRYYRRARALLFASFAESYGIPFLEARAVGLPILAAELDFVRDMCEPAQTFDPFSAISIARAVKRFLGQGEKPLNPLAPGDFIEGLLSLANRSV